MLVVLMQSECPSHFTEADTVRPREKEKEREREITGHLTYSIINQIPITPGAKCVPPTLTTRVQELRVLIRVYHASP